MNGGLGAALARLDAHLARLDPPVRRDLQPGLPRDETAARVRDATGLTLPDQVLEWFAWHDGVAARGELAPHPFGTWELLRLEKAIEWCLFFRRTAVELTAEDPVVEAQDMWDPGWFPIATEHSGRPLVVDCGDDAHGHVKLVWEDRTLDTFPSLEWVVNYWVDLFDQGMWDYDHQSARWVNSDQMTPEQLRGPY